MNTPRQFFLRLLSAFVLISICDISILAQPGFESLNFKHKWELKMLESGFMFISKSPAPVPFSMTGEPQATFDVFAYKLDPSKKYDLLEKMKEEVKGIRHDLIIDDYLEKDFLPKDNIVSYSDTLAGSTIAVIKYRTYGGKKSPVKMPRSVKQVLFTKNNLLYISSLIVLFGEDQENIRNDQMKLVEYILKN